jgi:hypothetical protein
MFEKYLATPSSYKLTEKAADKTGDYIINALVQLRFPWDPPNSPVLLNLVFIKSTFFSAT